MSKNLPDPIHPSEATWFVICDDPRTGMRVPAKIFERDGVAGLVLFPDGCKQFSILRGTPWPVRAGSLEPIPDVRLIRQLLRVGVLA